MINTEAHVICCNDSVEHVFVGPLEAARAKMAELQLDFYNIPERRYSYISLATHHQLCKKEAWSESQILEQAYKRYQQDLRWHIVTCSSNFDPQSTENLA